MSQQNLSSFICSVADLLRSDYKQSGYGRVLLPFTTPKRLACVLEPTKEVAFDEKKTRESAKINLARFLQKNTICEFYSTRDNSSGSSIELKSQS